jgi:hypothetical protein
LSIAPLQPPSANSHTTQSMPVTYNNIFSALNPQAATVIYGPLPYARTLETRMQEIANTPSFAPAYMLQRPSVTVMADYRPKRKHRAKLVAGGPIKRPRNGEGPAETGTTRIGEPLSASRTEQRTYQYKSA